MRIASLRSSAVIVVVSLAAACAGGSGATSAGESEGSSTATTSGAAGTDGMSSTSAAATSSDASTTSTTAATSTSTSGETDATGESDTTGCSFLFCSDVVVDCVSAPGQGGALALCECDVWAQDCPEGEKCTPWANDGGGAWNALKCVPIDPRPDAVGEACTVEGSAVSGIDSCDASSICWNVDSETLTGVCVARCEGSAEACSADPASCCAPGFACSITNEGVLILCLQTCDPLVQDCVGDGEVCYPVGGAFQCAPDTSGDGGAAGGPCEFINGCDAGNFCGDPAAYPGCDPMASGCCIPFCELDAPACVDGTECVGWYEEDPPPGYEGLGVCLIPS